MTRRWRIPQWCNSRISAWRPEGSWDCAERRRASIPRRHPATKQTPERFGPDVHSSAIDFEAIDSVLLHVRRQPCAQRLRWRPASMPQFKVDGILPGFRGGAPVPRAAHFDAQGRSPPQHMLQGGVARHDSNRHGPGGGMGLARYFRGRMKPTSGTNWGKSDRGRWWPPAAFGPTAWI